MSLCTGPRFRRMAEANLFARLGRKDRPVSSLLTSFVRIVHPVVLAIAVSGCHKQADDRLPVFPTRGKVFYRGKPADGALVQLHPLNLDKPLPFNPRARVSPDGTFALTTYDGHDGAPAGEYAVSVDWRRKLSDDETEEGARLLPIRYSHPDTSGLRVQIHAGAAQDNDLELHLK